MTVTGPSLGVREDVMARWRARSRLIRSLRLILPIALAGLATWLIAEIAWRQAHAPTASVQVERARMEAVNPRFTGVDEKGRQFQIIASRASRDESDLKQYQLQDVVVTLKGDSLDPVRLSARGGLYREDNGLVHLDGGVRVDDGRGNRFAASQSVVDTKSGKFTSSGGVTADGAAGSFSAGTYEGTRPDGTMVFSGGVHARLNGR